MTCRKVIRERYLRPEQERTEKFTTRKFAIPFVVESSATRYTQRRQNGARVVAKIIFVAGPYHGKKSEETTELAGRITLQGAHGPVDYILRGRPTPQVSIYVPDGATDEEIRQGLMDLVPTE
jgi:hypothetical protein